MKPENAQIAARLRDFGSSRYPSMAAFARALGMRPQELNGYLKGRAKPGNVFRERLMAVGADVDFILTGVRRNSVHEGPPVILVPFLGKIAAAPDGKLYFDDEVPQGATVPFFKTNHGELFALEVENDSLVHAQPDEIHPGDICIFSKDEAPKDGDIVAVQLHQNNDRMVKIFRWLSKHEIELGSANRFHSYSPRTVRRDEIASLAVYVGKITISEERKKKYGLRR